MEHLMSTTLVTPASAPDFEAAELSPAHARLLEILHRFRKGTHWRGEELPGPQTLQGLVALLRREAVSLAGRAGSASAGANADAPRATCAQGFIESEVD